MTAMNFGTNGFSLYENNKCVGILIPSGDKMILLKPRGA